MGHIEDLRKSVEITLTFLIAILISLLFFLTSSASHNGYTNNTSLSATQILIFQSAQENSFWLIFFKSLSFLALMTSIIIAWIFLILSYLFRNKKRQYYALIFSVISLTISVLTSACIIKAYSNYLPLCSAVMILGILIVGLITYLIASFLKFKAAYNSVFKRAS